MTQKEIRALKRRILGLRWDINRKEAKLQRLAKALVENASNRARFTRADYRGFFKSRRIKQSWV